MTLKDVALAGREGYVSVEHLKRYTTLGMATDQGKTSSVNGLAAMAALTGRTIEETGTTTYRPPFVPVPMGVIGGRQARRAPQSAEAPAARAGAPRRRGADARIWRLAEARLVRDRRPRPRHPERGEAGARHGRAVRRLLARQDRDHRPGRGEARRLPQLQPPLHAQARQDPLRLPPVGDGGGVRRRRDPAPRRGPLPGLLLVGPHGRGGEAARTLAAGPVRSAPRRRARHDGALGDADRHRPARPRPRRRARSSPSRSTIRTCRTWPSRRACSTAHRSGSRASASPATGRTSCPCPQAARGVCGRASSRSCRRSAAGFWVSKG